MLSNPAAKGRMLPTHFAPWNTVYFYYRKRKLEGVFEQIHNYLIGFVRKSLGREASPSLAIIDPRSVKTSRQGGERVYEKMAENQFTLLIWVGKFTKKITYNTLHVIT